MSCAVPAWQGDLVVDDDDGAPYVDVTMELFEDGTKLPYAGKKAATIKLYDPPPKIVRLVEFPDCVRSV